MISISLLVNIAILVPVCLGLILDTTAMRRVYADKTPARGILLAMYLAILGASIILLIDKDPDRVAVLLGMQVVYKVLTPFTVRSLRNPVVIANVLVAALHSCTVWLIWNSSK